MFMYIKTRKWTEGLLFFFFLFFFQFVSDPTALTIDMPMRFNLMKELIIIFDLKHLKAKLTSTDLHN